MDSIKDNIEKYFLNIDLDIRKNRNKSLRFTDQKATPDVISFIADCVVNLVSSEKTTFSRKDIENSDYFKSNIKLIFGKPLTNNEIDKFISQPLALLTYSQVLERNKRDKDRLFIYSIKNENMINYISINDRNTFHFLYYYFTKLFHDSSFKYFTYFIENNNVESYNLLREKFINFMMAYTNIGKKQSKQSEIEIGRIFTKIINIFACYNQTHGSISGHYSKSIITYSDLMYNRLNFRDIATKKEKNISRKEYETLINKESTNDEYLDNIMNRAIKMIKKLHPYSEINDALYGVTDAVHHIFSKSEYPQLRYFFENLIALTAGQHISKAHPNGKTQEIDRQYQLLCLYSKCASIFKNFNDYSIPNFIHVINVGLNLTDINKLTTALSENDIKEKLRLIYEKIY